MSMAPLRFAIHLGGSYTVMVSIYTGDGSVSVVHGGVEIGQGINTKVYIEFKYFRVIFIFTLRLHKSLLVLLAFH